MLELLFFVIGGGVGTSALLAWQRVRGNAAKKADEQKYKGLWEQAIELMAFNGQLTDEQVKAITPPKPKKISFFDESLPRGEGFSDDRRKVEVLRAQQGLPPADNLKGMFSDDIRKVHEARIKHGTAT